MKNDINDKNHLFELSNSDFAPAKGEPDIRGWLVKNNQGFKFGKVAEFLVDGQVGKVRYLVLDLKDNNGQLGKHQVLIPIGLAKLDATEDVVILPQVTVEQIRTLPLYEKGQLSRETELTIHQSLAQNNSLSTGALNNKPASGETMPDLYNHSHYHYSNIYHDRKAQTVIGLFDTLPAAQAAVKQLETAKIKSDKIELVTRYAPQNSDLVKVNNGPDAYDQFFYSLFASPADATANLEAARRSNAIVAVYTTTPEETRVASSILQENNTEANDITAQTAAANITPENYSKVPASAITSLNNSNKVNKEAMPQQNSKETPNNSGGERHHIVDRPMGEPIRQRELKEEPTLGNPTNGAVNFANFRPGIIELIEHTEVPVIRKEARVVEEVSIRKIVEAHEGIIQDSVRHTEIDIQRRNQDNEGFDR